MGGFLFHDLIFGPVQSRRLGRSLGINLLPLNAKWCNYNCIYCECGWTTRFDASDVYPAPEEIIAQLENVLQKETAMLRTIDAITFAGNGEPSLHPDFYDIVLGTVQLRDRFFPNAKIAVLTNATRLHLNRVTQALCLADVAMLKLDTAIPRSYELINQNFDNTSIENIIDDIAAFPGRKIIQTMFFRGEHKGVEIDNTLPAEIDAYIAALKRIQPEQVVIYSLDRDTPGTGLQKIDPVQLGDIATHLRAEGFEVVFTP